MLRSISRGACLVVALAWPAVAASASQVVSRSSSFRSSSALWATVDRCTSATSADVVGIRGSMPGTGNPDEEMYMRFRLQYRDATTDVWHYIGASADSGFIDVGSSRYRARQAGISFHLDPSTAAGTVFRGIVLFDWRIGTRGEHHAQLKTTAGHVVSGGASPAGYSRAHCAIS